MALFPDPFDALSSLQRAMDTFRTSGWLASGPSGGGAYPPMNVFRKGDDFYVITELAGVNKSELEVKVKGGKTFKVRLRIDTPNEVDYYKHGGILPFVLRELLPA